MKTRLLRLASTSLALILLGAAFRFESQGQGLPAPTVDRVGFPANYKTTFTKLLTVDRPDNGQIRVIWGNQTAANTPWWERYPQGSVLLFESWSSKRDSDNNLLLDANGRLIPDVLSTLFVKRKDAGFGTDYKDIRNGEWEYVAYRAADGTTQTAPSASGACAACHLQAGGPRDWTFRRQSFAGSGTGAIPNAAMVQYSFVPQNLTVKKGTVVTWYNNDEVQHQISVPSLGAFSNVMEFGQSYSQKFDVPGDYNIQCTIHAGMKATIKVTP